jgi:hypothetical protein
MRKICSDNRDHLCSNSAVFAIICLCIAFARASVAIISIGINSYDRHARSAWPSVAERRKGGISEPACSV